MAEHALRLKATLDTQEVQAELQKLREQQKQALGGANGANPAAPNANLQNLNSTLGKLNMAIMQLQKTMQGLASAQKAATAASSASPGRSQFIPPIAIGLGSKIGTNVGKVIEREVNNAVLKSIRANDGGLIAQQLPGPGGIFNGFKGSVAQQEAFNRLYAGARSTDFWRDPGKIFGIQKPFYSGLTPTGKEIFYGNQMKQSQFMKGAKFMAGSYALGSLASMGEGQTWAEAPVSKGIGALAGTASSAIMAGAGASMLGLGPAGVALAAGIPAAQGIGSAIGEWKAEKITALASALGRANAAFESMYEDFQKWDFSKFQEKVQGLNFTDLTGERSKVRSEYDTAKADYDNFYSGWTKKMSKLDSQYFSGKITATEYGNQKEDLENEKEAYKEELKKAADKLAAVNQAYETQKAALDNMTNVVREAIKFEDSLKAFKQDQGISAAIKSQDVEKIKALQPEVQAQIDKANEAMKPIADGGGLAEYEKRTNIYRKELLQTQPGSAEADSLKEIIKAREEAAKKYKEAAADMMKAVGKSKNLESAIDQLIKQMEEYAKSAKSQRAEVARGQEEAQNKYNMKWTSMSKEGLQNAASGYWTKATDFRKAYLEALTQVENAKTPEEAKAAQEKADEAKTSWQFSQQQATSFDMQTISRLQEQLGNMKAPSMTQVNSLASQGFMTSKSDDEIRWKQQTDYLSQQVQIQREIRDITKGMDNSATFN